MPVVPDEGRGWRVRGGGAGGWDVVAAGAGYSMVSLKMVKLFGISNGLMQKSSQRSCFFFVQIAELFVQLIFSNILQSFESCSKVIFPGIVGSTP